MTTSRTQRTKPSQHLDCEPSIGQKSKTTHRSGSGPATCRLLISGSESKPNGGSVWLVPRGSITVDSKRRCAYLLSPEKTGRSDSETSNQWKPPGSTKPTSAGRNDQ